MYRFLEELRRMIRIDSVSFNGNEEIANYVCTLMQDRGLKTIVQHVTHAQDNISKRQFNVIGIFGDSLVDRKIRKGLMLASHLDTVSPGIYDHWSQNEGDPFELKIVGNIAYGLGVARAKADFLCKLHAMERFREKKLKHPVYLVGTCGAHEGMIGARYFLKSLALNPAAILVGVPTDLAIASEFRSAEIFTVRLDFQLVEKDPRGFSRKVILHIFGKSAHSAYPEHGSNAIRAGLNFLAEAMQTGFEMRFLALASGQTLGQVPDHARLEFCINAHQFEDFKNFFYEATKVLPEGATYHVEFSSEESAGVRFLPGEAILGLVEIVALFEQQAIFVAQQDTPALGSIQLSKMLQSPSVLEFLFDARFEKCVDVEQVVSDLKRQLSEFRKSYPQLNMSLARKQIAPAFTLDQSQELVKFCQKAYADIGIEGQFLSQPDATEASLYQSLGYPCMAVGPGSLHKNIVVANESTDLEQCERAVDFYERMIQSVAE
jgi:acetylornithine deacetylase/succinyl-diaminopimelate desuccinylase-like protein